MEKTCKIFNFLFILISIQSVFRWSRIGIGNTTVVWLLDFATIFVIIWNIKGKSLFLNKNYLPCLAFIVCCIVSFFRGLFIAENYWENKQIITGVLTVSIIIFAYYLSIPTNALYMLRSWNKCIIPIFFFLYSWKIDQGYYAFALAPIYYFYGLFFHLMPQKWKIIIGILLLSLFAGFDNRSAIIKAVMLICVAFGLQLHKYIPKIILSITHWLLYLAFPLFLYLGVTGTFNIFSPKGNHIEERTIVWGKEEEAENQSSINSDTRTFMYEEVILSAIVNDYVLEGRSLARGNDSASFGERIAKDLGTDKMERYKNEAGHLNIFTWMGLIGVILYTAIYLQATCLALYASKNYYVKYIAILVAFHWLYGWVEESCSFNNMDIILWLLIAICTSSQFRNMTNAEFRLWIKSVFSEDETIFLRYRTIKRIFFVKLCQIAINNKKI